MSSQLDLILVFFTDAWKVLVFRIPMCAMVNRTVNESRMKKTVLTRNHYPILPTMDVLNPTIDVRTLRRLVCLKGYLLKGVFTGFERVCRISKNRFFFEGSPFPNS